MRSSAAAPAVAIDGGKAWLAFATDAPAPRPANGAAAAAARRRGRRRAERRATSARADGAPASARRPLRARHLRQALRRPARATPARAWPSTREPLLAQRSPQIAEHALGRARLRDGAAVLATSGDRTDASRFKLTADPVGLTRRRPAARHRRRSRPRRAASAPLIARPARPRAHPRLRPQRRPALGARPPRPAPRLPEARPDDLGPNGTITSPSTDLSATSPRASSRPTPATGRPSSGASTRSRVWPASRCSTG